MGRIRIYADLWNTKPWSRGHRLLSATNSHIAWCPWIDQYTICRAPPWETYSQDLCSADNRILTEF